VRRVREYAEVEHRLRRAAGKELRQLCVVRGRTLWWLEVGTAANTRAEITLTGGVHGDEPAGVEAVLRFLEERPGWAQRVRFTIFPCMNPHGYEHDTRHNHAGIDLNRQYRDSSVPEVAAQKRALAGRRFDLHMTLHEDVDARGFYIYELSRNNSPVARWIVENVTRLIPFDPRGIIEGRRAQRGVIRRTYPPRDMKQWPEAIYMFSAHADHTLTTETPGPFAFEKRVQAQGLGLRTACEWLASARPRRGAAGR